MAQAAVPHLTNDIGANQIRIGVKEFTCIGARPPFDHPHVYLDMGKAEELVCPYCSTLFRHDPALKPSESAPEGCVVELKAPVVGA